MFFNGITPNQKKCCGCEGCRSICPTTAISMTTNSDGFILPEVNSSICIECGICEKVCPMYHSDDILPDNNGNAYASINNNVHELKESSSGGIFSIIADYILEKGGIVCGAAFDEQFKLRHILIEEKSDLINLRGSKYLQSTIGNIYTDIRQLLNSGKLVYFVGTGCQVAGLRLFLRKEYTNLFTSDILCHGVPPQSVFNEVIKEVETKNNGKIEKYLFRDKSVWGWSCSSSSSIRIGSKLKYLGNEPIQQAYFNAFIKAVNYRESCYVCPYAQSHRPGDITLGDFWGIEKCISIPNIRDGVSAILVNSHKGQILLERIKNKMDLYPASIKDISQINRTLIRPTSRPEIRNKFFLDFKENPIQTLLKYYNPNIKHDLLYLLKRNRLTSKMIIILKRILHK